LFIAVRKVARSRDFYSRVLGGTVVLDENPCMVRLSNSWIIMNPGGPPTPDKPDISVVDYQPDNTTSIFLNLRVADIHACYEEWKAKGAEFLTPPIDRGAEIRCYMRDPDGYLIEVGQSTGLLHGKLGARRIFRAESADRHRSREPVVTKRARVHRGQWPAWIHAASPPSTCTAHTERYDAGASSCSSSSPA
jgi:catechol 2,3-dioxygenase-like lactoylglutathione lyase family enzyme